MLTMVLKGSRSVKSDDDDMVSVLVDVLVGYQDELTERFMDQYQLDFDTASPFRSSITVGLVVLVETKI